MTTASIPSCATNVVDRGTVPINGRAIATLTAAAAGALLLAAPAAHADSSCTVNGEYLHLFHPDGAHSLAVSANGSSLGPGAVVSSGGTNPVYGKASGSIAGRTVDFIITWDDGKGSAHYRGTVGDDGDAHGTATGNVIPINLWNPGSWDSTDPLSCDTAGKPKQGPGVSWDPVPGGLVAHVTDRSGVDSQCTYKADAYARSFFLKAGKTYDVVMIPAIPKFANWDVTVTCDNGAITHTSTFF